VIAPIDLGSRRELFVDSLLVDRLKKASLHLHEPQPREVVLQHDTAWEGPITVAGGYRVNRPSTVWL
jgi:hypothetical protein